MANNKKFTFIDLFAGIGGIRIAFERVGGKCVFTSEWDKSCQVMYEANFGDKPHGDITKLIAEDIPYHDILTGGFPCQAFSIIGNGRGFADTRGTLFFDIERIIRAKQPKAFLLENVKQLISHDGGRTFKVILEKLESLGYYVHYKVLNGLDFGVPQKRERIMLVGFKKNYPFEFPQNGTEVKTLSDILDPDNEIDKKHFLSDYFRKKIETKLKEQNKKITVRPVILHENKGGNLGIHPHSCALRASGSYNYLTVNGERRLTPREMLRLQGFPDTFKMVVPDTQVRKQAGNSVVIPKIEAVAHAMMEAMKNKPQTQKATQVDLYKANLSSVREVEEYIKSSSADAFSIMELVALFKTTPGLRRSIDKMYEILVYALFASIVRALKAQITLEIGNKDTKILKDFERFIKMVLGIDAKQTRLILPAALYRVGVTNAADRGLDMWTNFGPAIQVKHLTLTTELMEDITDGISADKIVIVCIDAEKGAIESLLKQVGWSERVQGIITIKDLDEWYKLCLSKKYRSNLGLNLLKDAQREFSAEFPSSKEIKPFMVSRKYDEIVLPSDWEIVL